MLKTLMTVATLAAFAAPALAADYSVDPAHSSVSFSIRHNMISTVTGSFGKFNGEFSFDEKKPEASKVTFTVDAASIDTNNEKRDEHLRSPDFFNASECKELKFVSTKVTKAGGKKMKATGDLTMHCQTKPATFDIEYLGQVKDPWGNMKAGFVATSKVNRKDFGLVWNKNLDAGGVVLGDTVDIKLDVQGAQKGASPADAAKAESKDVEKKSEAKKK